MIAPLFHVVEMRRSIVVLPCGEPGRFVLVRRPSTGEIGALRECVSRDGGATAIALSFKLAGITASTFAELHLNDQALLANAVADRMREAVHG